MVGSLRLYIFKSYLVRIKYLKEWLSLVLKASKGDDSPVLFTSQKCASTFLDKFIGSVAVDQGLTSYNYESLIWNISSVETEVVLQEKRERIFSRSGALYGPIRRFVDVPNLANRNILLVLRDPRDVVVSEYYSVAYSHALPGNKRSRDRYLIRRERAKSQTVDEYAVEAAYRYKEVYSQYAKHLLGKENVTFLTYEEMVADFDTWCLKAVSGLGLNYNEACYSILRKESGSASGSGEVSSHRRNGTPGEYRRILNDHSKERVEEILRSVINEFGVWFEAPTNGGC